MLGFKTDTSAMRAALRKAPKRLKDELRVKVRKAVYFAHKGVTERTPVWSGAALASYVWSTSGTPGRAHPGFAPTPGTNRMPLGPEPNRRAAQAVADASLKALSFDDPFQKFVLNNNSPHIGGLEYGKYPLPPLRQRSPLGMFRVTLATLAARMNAGAL